MLSINVSSYAINSQLYLRTFFTNFTLFFLGPNHHLCETPSCQITCKSILPVFCSLPYSSIILGLRSIYANSSSSWCAYNTFTPVASVGGQDSRAILGLTNANSSKYKGTNHVLYFLKFACAIIEPLSNSKLTLFIT